MFYSTMLVGVLTRELLTTGILRDVSFKNMKDQDWDLIWDVHVKGSYKVLISP